MRKPNRAENGEIHRKAGLLILLVFALGVVYGLAVDHLLTERAFASQPTRSPHDSQTDLMPLMTRELSLSVEQQTQINVILADMQARYSDMRREADIQYKQLGIIGLDQIRQTLTTDQRQQFEILLARLEKERHSHGGQSH